MQTLNFTVREQEIRWSCQRRKPVEGSIGEVLVQFDVDNEWDGFAEILAVFVNDSALEQPAPVRWTGEPVPVPALALVYGTLRVGLLALSADKSRRLTTRWMPQGVPIHRSSGNGGEAVDPDPNRWDALMQMLGNMSDLDTDDKSSLVAAINEAYARGVPADQGLENAGKLLYVAPDGLVSILALGTGLQIINGVLSVAGAVAPEPDDTTTAILGVAILGKMIL